MRKMLLLLFPMLLLLPSCATTPQYVPVATSCPKLPPLPNVLTSPASIAQPLNQRLESSLATFEDSLTKAQRQP